MAGSKKKKKQSSQKKGKKEHNQPKEEAKSEIANPFAAAAEAFSAGSGAPVANVFAAPPAQAAEETTSETFEEASTAKFAALVEVEAVEVKSGEEEEELIWTHRCALYRFGPDVSGQMMWCDRGRGDIKVLKARDSSSHRMILREDKTGKLRLNSQIAEAIEMTPNGGSDKAWTWACVDFSEGNEAGKMETMAVRFKNAEIANTFKAIVEGAKAGDTASVLASLEALSLEQEHNKDVSEWKKVLKEAGGGKLSKPALTELWNTFDKDESGFIDAEELSELASSLFDAMISNLGDAVPPQQVALLEDSLPHFVQGIMQKLDQNKDGKISWEEFAALDDVTPR